MVPSGSEDVVIAKPPGVEPLSLQPVNPRTQILEKMAAQKI